MRRNSAKEIQVLSSAPKKVNGSGPKSEKAEEAKKEIDIAEVVRAAKEGSTWDPQVISFLKESAQGRDALAGRPGYATQATSTDAPSVVLPTASSLS
jgi:phage FluMu gp28-like protein